MVGVRANIIYVLRKQSVYIIWFWGELNLYFLVKRMALKSCCVLMICLNVGSLYASQGQVLFEENCAACHGEDGVPALRGTPHFARGERLEKTDVQLLESIAKGMNVMPPWEGVLDDKEMKECLDYARSLSDQNAE